MKKKILILGLLVVILLLLMPSIPSIHTNTIRDGIKQNIQERLNGCDDVKDMGVLYEMKHPILYIFVKTIDFFRFLRRDLWMRLTDNVFSQIDGLFTIDGYSIIFYIGLFRFWMIWVISIQWREFWGRLNEDYGWNWDLW